MAVYEYRAVDAGGRATRGQLDAAGLPELESRLAHMGLELVRARAQPGRKGVRHGPRVARRDLIQFCFHLEQFTAAGIPLLDGLRDLRDGVDHPSLGRVAGDLIDAIEAGKNLSQALAEHPRTFDPVFVSLVRAGEHAGRLPEVLASLAAQLRWEDEIAARTRALLHYPLFVGVVVAALAIFLLVYLVPQLASFMRGLGHALPLQTRLLLWASEFCVRFGWIVLLVIGVLPIALRTLVRRDPRLRDAVDRFKFAAPLFGPILRKIALSRLASSFALMYGSGILVLDALRHAEDIVSSRPLRDAVRAVAEQVAQGWTLSSAFAETGLFPPLVVRMLRIGEQTGGLDTALRNVSYFYNREVHEAVERVQALAEPVLTVLLGGLLAWIMLAVLGPVYDTIAGAKL